MAREELRSAIANLQSLVQAVSNRLIEISGPLGSAENRWQTIDGKLRDMEAELQRLATSVGR